MNAHMSYPPSNSTNVDPMTEILVTFENSGGDRKDINIIVDGEWAVREGLLEDPFLEVRFHESGGVIQIGVRKRIPLAPRDIMVSAWCKPGCSSVEQRFFVRGAKTNVLPPNSTRSCWSSGGFFSTDKGSPFPSRIVVTKDGEVIMDESRHFIPPEIVSDEMDIIRFEGSWIMVSSRKGKTYISTPDRLNVYDFDCTNISVNKDLISAKLDGGMSIHLPTSYIPSSTERDPCDWFSFSHEGNWSMRFEKNIHVWWNEEEMMVKHEPNPLLGLSDDMLWTNKDIKSDFTSVRIVDKNHVVVNDSMYLDTINPKITKI